MDLYNTFQYVSVYSDIIWSFVLFGSFTYLQYGANQNTERNRKGAESSGEIEVRASEP